MSLTLLASLPFLGAVLVALLARFGRNAVALVAGFCTALALMGLFGHVADVLRGDVVLSQTAWLPSAGLNAHFMLDGLGLLFALLILGIGLLIVIYARFYLSPTDPFARFFVFLLLFQGAMLGIVLSDNILLLLLFWEMTSLTSFLLIGYWHGLPAARSGARMALAVTGAGGLALFAGLLLLGQAAGSYDISVILTKASAVQASPMFVPAMALILVGAFTKSAQFPFHFWLPRAMAAPTPVSAYLHSATMVKAGLFLLARFWPVFASSEVWFYALTGVGLATMLFGAKVALFKDDLKAILAYSTISHLGLITFLLGLGTKAGAGAAMVHILAHASFKAPLFMVAGIVDHAAHTRDLRSLGGLRAAMPISFALALVAALSMAGVPPLAGFLSKEMALEVAAHTAWAGAAWAVPVMATLGAVLSVAYTLRFLGGVFLGPQKPDLRAHEAGLGLLSAPAVLVMLGALMGLAPMAMMGPLVTSAAGSVMAGAAEVHLTHWHGLQSPALWMSVFAFGGAIILLASYDTLRRIWDRAQPPQGKTLFDATQNAVIWAGQTAVLRLHDGALSRNFAIAIGAVLAGASAAFLGGTLPSPSRAMIPVTGLALAITLVLLAALLLAVSRHANRVFALLLVGVIGLLVAAGFAFFSAPDLAITQITVEVVTVILMLLALNILPKTTPLEGGFGRQVGRVLLAVLAGCGTGALAFALMRREAGFAPISAFHLEQSKPGAGGTNAVNTIIVDFRGFDTYGEIIVLGIAALIIAALVQGLLGATAVLARLDPIFPLAGRAGDRHPMMLVVATRFMLPIGLLIGVYIYLRGHNLPGGGFVAGLVVAISFLLQYIASGFGWSMARQRLAAQSLIGAGVLTASATGIGSFVAGRPFLTSNFTYVSLPPLETFELATAALFDLGVFLCVLGAVMLALASLAKLAQAGGEAASKTPFDVALPHIKARAEGHAKWRR